MQVAVAGWTLLRGGELCRRRGALLCNAAPALAQGSTGGSIGKQDKSVSRRSGGGGAVDVARARAPVAQRTLVAKRSGGGGGGGGNFDGTWASASQGRTTCSDRTTDVVTISGGQMSGPALPAGSPAAAR